MGEPRREDARRWPARCQAGKDRSCPGPAKKDEEKPHKSSFKAEREANEGAVQGGEGMAGEEARWRGAVQGWRGDGR